MRDITLARKMQRDARKAFIPIGAILELTPRCTLDCNMCYCHLTEAQMNGRKEFTAEEWIQFIDTAYDRGVYAVLLTGGECLLHKGFWEIYNHCRSRGIVVSVNTNATLITDQVVRNFKASPPRQIQVTIYGSSEETYYNVTGYRVYGKVTENVLKLKNAGLNVVIAITPNKYLVEDIPAIMEFARDNHIKCAMNNALVEAKEDTGRSLAEFGMTLEQRIRAFELYEGFDGRERPENPEQFCIPKLKETTAQEKGLWCSAGRCAFNLTWDGKMVPCYCMPQAAADYRTLGFDECWKRMNEAVENFIPPVECLDCQFKKDCHACAVTRTDPKNPGHCNRDCCMETVGLYNMGLRGRGEKK